MPLGQALAWMAQAAEALLEAHQAGIVHGDIKPANLMIDASGRLRILDLGLARCVDPQSTLAGSEFDREGGTLAYMAPEQFIGTPPNVQTDLYALGVTIHELASGLGPGSVAAGLGLAHHRLHDDSALPAGAITDPGVLALLGQMTARLPQQRLQDMSQLLVRLQTLDGSPKRGSSPGSVAVKPRRRGAMRAQAGLAGGLLLVAALVNMPGLPGDVETPGPLRTAQRLDQQDGVDALLRAADEDAAGLDAGIARLEALLAEPSPSARSAALLAIAYCLKNAGNARDGSWLARARASADLALRGDDQLALAHTADAWVLELQGQDGPAQAAYARALALDPQEFHALNGLGQLHLKYGRPDAAIGVFETALRYYPEEPTFLNAWGAVLYQRGDQAGAERLFRRSIAARPAAVSGYVNLGASLASQHRFDESLHVLQQGLGMRPDARLYANVGNTQFTLGRYVESADAFERALSARNGSPNDYRNWANLGDALGWVPGRGAAAKTAYTRALQLLSPQLNAAADATQLSRASLYAARLGQAAQAERWSTQALATGARDASVRLRLAVASELLGQRDAALEHVRAALQAGLPASALDDEPDLRSVRRDRRFHQLVTQENP